MPPDTVSALTPPVKFALRLAGWSLALFGLFRVPWTGAHIFLPATQAQAAVGAALFGRSSLPVEATLACSGADALALCCAAIAAYPVRWRMRAAGIAIGTAGILGLNRAAIASHGLTVKEYVGLDLQKQVDIWAAHANQTAENKAVRQVLARKPIDSRTVVQCIQGGAGNCGKPVKTVLSN